MLEGREVLTLSFIVVQSEQQMVVARTRTLRIRLDLIPALKSLRKGVGLFQKVLEVRQSYYYRT